LDRLHKVSGRHIAALRLELRAQQGGGNWDAVLRLVRLLEKHNALLPEVAHEVKLKAHQENIRQRRTELARLQAYQNALPNHENNPRLVHELAKAMFELGAHEAASRCIEVQLDREWDSPLVTLYGQSREGDLALRITRAETWLTQHRDDFHLVLALGRMCLAQHLWGKAQGYLEAALSMEDLREIRLDLARLFEQTERAAEALPHYRAAAEQRN